MPEIQAIWKAEGERRQVEANLYYITSSTSAWFQKTVHLFNESKAPKTDRYLLSFFFLLLNCMTNGWMLVAQM